MIVSILLLVCFFVFLFCLFTLGNDDFVILRRNVSMDQMFNLAFLAGLVSLFFARAFFVATHFRPMYLHPLVFPLFPYFPGLSLAGGIIGGAGFLVAYAKYRKLPIGRLFDCYFFAMLSTLPIGFLIACIVHLSLHAFIAFLLYTALFFLFVIFFLPQHGRGEFRHGGLGLAALLSFAAVGLLLDVTNYPQVLIGWPSFDGILYGVTIVVCLVLLITQERFLKRQKKAVK